MESEDITEALIREKLSKATNLAFPCQKAVSLPMIKRYYRLMKLGYDLGEICINSDRNAIVDGHHRYLCHILLDSLPNKREYPIPNATQVLTWDVVVVDIEDHDKDYNKKNYFIKID